MAARVAPDHDMLTKTQNPGREAKNWCAERSNPLRLPSEKIGSRSHHPPAVFPWPKHRYATEGPPAWLVKNRGLKYLQ